MTTPEQHQQTARRFVEDLLKRRLENGGISTARPDLYFQCAEERARHFPATRVLQADTEVRVKTWRQWSDAQVTFDEATGELVGWKVTRFADPPNQDAMTQDDAVDAVVAAVQIPQGAEITSFSHYEYAPERHVARIEWQHMHRGLRVDGDYMWAVVHPQTRRVIEFSRHWHEPKLT